MSVSLPCIACGCALPDALYLESAKDNQPYAGTAFITSGHYGSTVFDPMDGSALELNICDPCLVRGGRAGRVLEKRFRKTRLWKPKAGEAARAAAAIATEARRAATGNTDAVHEGAGPKDIAQKDTPHD